MVIFKNFEEIQQENRIRGVPNFETNDSKVIDCGNVGVFRDRR